MIKKFKISRQVKEIRTKPYPLSHRRYGERRTKVIVNQRYEPRGKLRLLFRPLGRGIQSKEIEIELLHEGLMLLQ